MNTIAAAALAIALIVAGTLFGRRALLIYRLIRMGKPVARFDDLPARAQAEVVVVIGQSKLLQRLGPGLMHAAIFWGFIVLFPTIFIAMIGAVDQHATLPWLGRQGWYALLVAIFAFLVLAGVIAAFVIRKVQRPQRFAGSHVREADVILLLIAGIVISLFVWHASRIALGLNEYPAAWAPISSLPAQALHQPWTPYLERAAVWAHVLIILSFLVYLPYSKHLHIFLAAVNVFFGRTRKRGRLEPVDLEAPDDQVRYGAATAADLTWKQMVDTMSCTECGRCQDVCPAFNTGKELSPKLLIMALRDQLLADGPKALAARGAAAQLPPLVPTAVTDNVVWDCVTCGATWSWSSRGFRRRRRRCCATSIAPPTRGASLRRIARTGQTGSAPMCSSPGRSPPTSCSGSAARRLTTSVPARVQSRLRSCSKRLASTSRSSGRASRAPATRRGGWVTSTRSSSRQGRTWGP